MSNEFNVENEEWEEEKWEENAVEQVDASRKKGKVKCHEPDKDCKKALCYVIDSIAQEEYAISDLLTAESLKIKKAVSISCKVDELLEINASVSSTLKNIIKLQMLLQFKLEEATKALEK